MAAGPLGPSRPRSLRWRSSATCRCWRTRSWPGGWRGAGVPMVFWHQDIYSEAIGSAARRRLPVVGPWISRLAERLERTIARRSGAIVAISPTFLDRLAAWGVVDKSVVVPNWAPIDELPMCDGGGGSSGSEIGPANEWRSRAGLLGHPVVLYSGTLGLKHDPGILASLAEHLRESHPSARVVVISEGKGRDWLEEWKRGGAPPPTTSSCWTSSLTRTSPPSWGAPTSSWRCWSPTRRDSRCPRRC